MTTATKESPSSNSAIGDVFDLYSNKIIAVTSDASSPESVNYEWRQTFSFSTDALLLNDTPAASGIMEDREGRRVVLLDEAMFKVATTIGAVTLLFLLGNVTSDAVIINPIIAITLLIISTTFAFMAKAKK